MHHRLLRLGLNAKQILLVTFTFNASMIALTLMLSHLGNFVLIFMQIGVCMIFNAVLTYLKGKKVAKSYRIRDVIVKDTLKV